MSREIKFRVWDESSMIMRSQSEYNAVVVDCFLNSGLVLMQYTGLKDKSGVEIYEGDWVTASIETPPSYSNPDDNIYFIQGRVFFDAGCFLFGNGNYLDGDHIWDLEIIGNVHENPELLEAK